MLRLATQLLRADKGERSAEALVLDNRPLVDLLDLVKGTVGEFNPAVADCQAAVGIIDDGEPLADRRLGLLAWLQDEHNLVVLQGQRLRQGALLLPGKGVVEIVAGAQRPVQILIVGRRFGKARVVVGDESREEGVALRQSCPHPPAAIP